MRRLSCWLTLVVTLLVVAASAPAAEPQSYDVVVYGGTSGGAAAAIQAAKMGKSVVLIEPGKHIGGLTSGGLGATDIGNKAAIGGLSRGFYERISHPAVGEWWIHGWSWQPRGAGPCMRSRAPDFGGENREILAELGFGSDEIDALLREGVVATLPQNLPRIV